MAETGRPPRPMPDDFLTVAVGKTRAELCEIYKAGKRTIARWRDEAAGKSKVRLREAVKLPPNIDELAKGQHIAGLAKMLNMHSATLWTKLKRHRPDLFEMCRVNGRRVKIVHAGIAAQLSYRDKPEGFDEIAAGMSLTQVARHYNASPKTVRKWLETSPQWVRDGMAKAAKERSRAAAINSARNQVRATRKQPNKPGTGFALRYLGDTVREPAIISREKQAMRYLQKFGPCYPMSVHNKALDGYSFKGIRMTAAQIIAEAEKRGWNPDAWREIAQERAA